MFNIFMNDFVYLMEGHCDLYCYADDNTLSFHGDSIHTASVKLLGVYIDDNLKFHAHVSYL